jgi:ferredoxin
MPSATQAQVYRLGPEALAAWLGGMIQRGRRVIAPVDRRGFRVFREVTRADDVRLADGKARWSPKEHLFPRTETLFRFEADAGGVRLHDPEAMRGSQVLFGVTPCDAAGLLRLDAILGADASYADRRSKTTIVALACAEAGPECFCAAVGGSPAGEDGADLLIAAAEDGWLVRILTVEGEAAVAPWKPAWCAATPGDWEAVLAKAREVGAAMTRRPIPESWAPVLEQSFDDPKWTGLARRCVGCGICTYVCPSCSCFDVADEGGDACGSRCRTWDSCSFRQFTLHGSGHNPRADQAARSRQRVLHKFAYFPLQHGGAAMCVGCGRCIGLCPVGMDIHDEVVQVMAGKSGEEVSDVQP